MLFRGLSSINLDAKGRMAMPARYREMIDTRCEGKLVVTLADKGEALVIYTLNDFEVIQEKIEALPSINEGAKRLKRLVVGHANDVEMDANGRILIPPLLRNCVGLNKHVVLVGQGKKLELWDEEAWNTGREEWLSQTGDESQLSEQLQNLSL